MVVTTKLWKITDYQLITKYKTRKILELHWTEVVNQELPLIITIYIDLDSRVVADGHRE